MFSGVENCCRNPPADRAVLHVAVAGIALDEDDASAAKSGVRAQKIGGGAADDAPADDHDICGFHVLRSDGSAFRSNLAERSAHAKTCRNAAALASGTSFA